MLDDDRCMGAGRAFMVWYVEASTSSTIASWRFPGSGAGPNLFLSCAPSHLHAHIHENKKKKKKEENRKAHAFS